MKQLVIPAVAAAAIASAAAPQALAQDKTPPRILTVTGSGEASAAPDLALLSVGVEAEGATAAAALKANAQAMNATIARLKKSGVAEKDIQTQNLNVSPRYNYNDENRNQPPKILGYVASNMVAVKLRDLDKAGGVIDQAVADGANSLGSLSFSFANPDKLMNEARKDAIADARERAKLYAEAAGVTLGPILQIQDGYAAPPPMPYMDGRAMAMEAKSTPISAGESTVTANITLIYEIR
jgi:uncharacterized protein YggE